MIRSTLQRLLLKRRAIMNKTKFASENASEFGVGRKLMLGVSILLLVIWARFSPAQAIKPKTFSSEGAASHALYLAVRNEDEQPVGAILERERKSPLRTTILKTSSSASASARSIRKCTV
jgi:hypothetical protein